MIQKRQKAEQKGRRGETFAALALQLKGYRILERRYKTKLGEIDLIARRGDVVAIVEVKARKTLTEAMDAITPTAMRRIEAAADLYASKIPDYTKVSIRFDLIAILPKKWPQHVEEIFTP